MIGVFSEKAANLFGTSLYTSTTGLVEVTAVYSSIEDAEQNYLFDDMKIVGTVDDYAGKGRIGTVSFSKTVYVPNITRNHKNHECETI